MKKLYISLVVLTFLALPLGVFAAVNVTLLDTSTEEVNTISIEIDTETDTLEKVVLPIEFSENVSIVEVAEGSIECPTLEYSDSLENTILVNCELEEATALDGTLANIAFTNTEGNYSFTILEGDENLEIGTLSLGDIVNIGEITQTEAPETAVEDTEEAITEDDGLTLEEDSAITAQEEIQEGLPIETEEGFSMDTVTEYLPYILIGASVILLISIIAILLGKKKEPKKPKESKKTTRVPKTPAKRKEPQPPVQKESSDKEETLRSMVNNVNNDKAQEPETPQEPPQPTTPQPPTAQPTTPQQAAYTQQQQEPPMQKTASPQVPPKTQEEDLQEILNREVAANSQGQEDNTDSQTTPPQTPIQPTTQPNIEQTQAQPEVPFSGNLNVGNNTSLGENTPQTQPRAEVPNNIPTRPERPPASEENLQQEINEEVGRLETNNPPTPEYPSVPPSAMQPKEPQNQEDQGPPVAETPENLPEVPPAM
jgi:hypothetical protein